MTIRHGGRVLKQTSGNGAGGGNNGGRVTRLQAGDRVELVDPRAERDFLYSCSVYPELVLSSGVLEHELASTAHRVIFSALVYLAAEGAEMSTAHIRMRLSETGQLGLVGGDQYLEHLADGLPSRDLTGARRIRTLARRRVIAELAALVQAKAGEPEECERYLSQLAAAHASLLELANPSSGMPELAPLALTIATLGARLPTGLPSLDDATRGGIPIGKLVAIIGAPGASKTNLATWLGDAWERAGCAVTFLAADESRESIITRLGQLDGIERERLEGTDPGGRNALSRNFRKRSLAVIDPAEDKITLETAERLLVAWAGDKQRVLIVDSLQTIPCDAAMALETKREQVEAVTEVCKAIAKRGTLVVVISEMSRAGYRSAKADDNISALAAGAESRAIEFAAALLLGLRSVKGESTLIDVEVAKNRLGSAKPDLRVRVDHESLAFHEVERPDAEAEQIAHEVRRFDAVRALVIDAVRRDSEGHFRTVNALVRAVKGKRSIVLAVVRDLIEEGAVTKDGGTYRLTVGGAT